MSDSGSSQGLIGLAQDLFVERMKHPLVNGYILGFAIFNGKHFWGFFEKADSLSAVQYVGNLVEQNSISFLAPLVIMIFFPPVVAFVEWVLSVIDTVRGNCIAYTQKKMNKHDVHSKYARVIKSQEEKNRRLCNEIDNFLQNLEDTFPKKLEEVIQAHSGDSMEKITGVVGSDFIGEVHKAIEGKNVAKGEFIEEYDKIKQNL